MKHGYFEDATRDLRVSDSENERAAAARRLSFVNDREATPHLVGALSDPFDDCHMGITAENVAEKWGITRQAQDELALQSHQRAAAAIAATAVRLAARAGAAARVAAATAVTEHAVQQVEAKTSGTSG